MKTRLGRVTSTMGDEHKEHEIIRAKRDLYSSLNIPLQTGKKVCGVCLLNLGFRVHDLILDYRGNRAHFFFFRRTQQQWIAAENTRTAGDTTQQTTHTRTADGVRITGDTHAQQAIASGLDAAVDSRW